MVMYERLTQLWRGVINEYYVVKSLKAQTLQSSGSPVVSFEIVHIHYVGMSCTDYINP